MSLTKKVTFAFEIRGGQSYKCSTIENYSCLGQSRPRFVYFRSFLTTISIIQIEESVDGVLEIQTQGRRMVGADETTELWQLPITSILLLAIFQSVSTMLVS